MGYRRVEAVLLADWAKRIGPQAARLNRAAIRWTVVIACSSVVFAASAIIFGGHGVNSLDFKISTAWIPWILIASGFQMRCRRRARRAAAQWLGFTGKTQHVPVTKLAEFDAWYAKMKHSQWVQGPTVASSTTPEATVIPPPEIR